LRASKAIALCAIFGLVLCLHGFSFAQGDAGEFDQESLFAAIGSMYGIDADLLRAIALVESSGRPQAVSPAGAKGLMQLMPSTARRFGVKDVFDPVENALGAARFLSHLRSQQRTFSGEPDLVKILAAYNAGEGAVKRYGGVPPYRETRNYIRRVLLEYLFGPDELDPTWTRAVTSQPVAKTVGGREENDDAAVLRTLQDIRRQRAREATHTESSMRLDPR